MIESVPSQILNTVVMRPYFVLFFLTYLVGCSLHLGLRRALLFAIVGYLIAWLSEYSSIHTGIPFGLYHYTELTKGKELWLLGVPFMDSMSFVFLAYASYTMALMVTMPVLRYRGIYLLETKKKRWSPGTAILGALFFMYLDIIIDPVALQGHRWFLGRLYYYPEGGVYFGVPISNFAGWFVVGLLLISSLQALDRFLDRGNSKNWFAGCCPSRYLVGPILYSGVVVFNLSVAFAIGEYSMAWTGVFLMLLPGILLRSIVRAGLAQERMEEAVEAHLKDFSAVVMPASWMGKRPTGD